jgi:hypothetical protein
MKLRSSVMLGPEDLLPTEVDKESFYELPMNRSIDNSDEEEKNEYYDEEEEDNDDVYDFSKKFK